VTNAHPPRIISVPYELWNGLAKRAKLSGESTLGLVIGVLKAWLQHQETLDAKLAGTHRPESTGPVTVTEDTRPQPPPREEPPPPEPAWLVRPGRYRRRTTAVYALQWLGRDEDRLPMRTFLNDDRIGGSLALQVLDDDRVTVLVPTRTAHRTVALPGDWVIRDPVQGYLVCEEIDFPILYEPVTSPETDSVSPALPG
jgi:hypothetical protein